MIRHHNYFQLYTHYLMNKSAAFTIFILALCGPVWAQNLYYVGQEAEESIPLTWHVGSDLVWDNNINPNVSEGNPGFEEANWSINPYVEANLTAISPQTTINFYARLGVNYYLEEMESTNADEFTHSGKIGFDYNHSFTNRLRFSSRNYLSYEMEPEYSYGISTDRSAEPALFYNSNNSIGYRWTQRVGSYTSFAFDNYSRSGGTSDRSSWSISHQMRYQLSLRAVVTGTYRFAQSTGDASDSTNHYLTAGLEYRLSQNSVFLANAGMQMRDVQGGTKPSSPYMDASVRTQINSKFSVRGFVRYSMEDYETVQTIGTSSYEYSDKQVFRLGFTGEYALAPRLSGYGGIDYVTSIYDAGNKISGPGSATDEGRGDDLLNLYIGLRARFNNQLSGQCSINYTESTSDFGTQDYDRLRLSAGLSYTF